MVLSILTACEEDDYTTKSSIYGTVIEATDNTPIEGVIVTNQTTGKNCITKVDGRYEFQNLEFGKLTRYTLKKMAIYHLLKVLHHPKCEIILNLI